MPPQSSGKEDFFKELCVKFITYAITLISYFFGSNIFVSERVLFFWGVCPGLILGGTIRKVLGRSEYCRNRHFCKINPEISWVPYLKLRSLH